MDVQSAVIQDLDAFGVTALIEDGALRCIRFRGREVVRLIDMPIRDADWGTCPVVTESAGGSHRGFTRSFQTVDGAVAGIFDVEVEAAGEGARLVAELVLTPLRDTVVNRAGFVVLHPLEGVAGRPLEVRHSDGRREALCFPARIAPGQPVRDIAFLAHRVGDVGVALDFEGEVFEMEDQRNWTDASFKTYCRPLSKPRPYVLRKGEEVRQRIVLTLTRRVAADGVGGPAVDEAKGTCPAIMLAHEARVSGGLDPRLASLRPDGVSLRVGPGDWALPRADQLPRCPVTLEIVTGTDAGADIAAARDAAAGLDVRAVVALPQGYLASHQPEGPWPEGPGPMDMVPLLREAFPGAEVGGGMLTNFTEFNRCPPDPALIDFATFGTTAIVHAADDRSVVETLEAIPQVIESTRALVGDRPLRLGLMSIGMRSNPYGAGVVANPGGARLPMAMDDPRQRTGFAAAFAVGLAAACVRGGVASFAPAMTGGPLGMAGAEGVWPIWHVVGALAAFSGRAVTVTGGPAWGLVCIRGDGRRSVVGVAANLGPGEAFLEEAVLVPERAGVGWLDNLPAGGPLTLPPMTAALLTGGGA